MSKLNKPAETVLDTFGGTFVTAKACLFIAGTLEITGADSIGEHVETALLYVIHTFPLKVRYPETDISCDAAAMRNAKVFIYAMAQLTAGRRRNVWEVPASLNSWKCSSQHILN